MQSAIELRTLFGSARVFVFDCQRTVIESGQRSVDPFRNFDFAPNSLCDRVRQSRWTSTATLYPVEFCTHGGGRLRVPFTNQSFRATGITNYLRNGGTREKAQQMANHASARTTHLYDRRKDEVTVQEIEKVRFERIDVDVGGF